MTAADLEVPRDRLVLAAERAAAAGDDAAAADVAATVRWQEPQDETVLFQLSSIAIAACWPLRPHGGWRALDEACTELLDLDAARGRRAS